MSFCLIVNSLAVIFAQISTGTYFVILENKTWKTFKTT